MGQFFFLQCTLFLSIFYSDYLANGVQWMMFCHGPIQISFVRPYRVFFSRLFLCEHNAFIHCDTPIQRFLLLSNALNILRQKNIGYHLKISSFLAITVTVSAKCCRSQNPKRIPMNNYIGIFISIGWRDRQLEFDRSAVFFITTLYQYIY